MHSGLRTDMYCGRSLDEALPASTSFGKNCFSCEFCELTGHLIGRT